MAIDFPNTPTTNQVFTYGNRSWKYDGSVWNSIGNTIQGITGLQGIQGIQGVQGLQGLQGSLGLQGVSGVPAAIPYLKQLSGLYYQSIANVVIVATGTPVTNTTYYTPYFVPYDITYNQIAIRAGSTFSGTATVRVGIYADNGGQPSTVILDAGTVSVTTASAVYTVTINQTLTAGWYWLAANCQAAATTNTFYFATNTNPQLAYGIPAALNAATNPGWSQSGVTGAFGTAASLTGSTAFLMAMRTA